MDKNKSKKAKYKPLLYTTTVRNPERIKYNLYILKKFEGQILTNELAVKIVGELIRYGLYRPMKYSTEVKAIWKQTPKGEFAASLLNDTDVKKLQKDNPQQHKEAGFDWGYPSRFATIFDLAKELGFVYFKNGSRIEFSELGNLLVEIINLTINENNEITVSLENQEKEQQVFLQSLARSQRNNPFVKVLNNNIPLLLLLQTIQLINYAGGKGISRQEIPLLLFWKDNDASTLYDRISKLRKEHGFVLSDEMIINICINEIMGGKYKKFRAKSIMQDYTDEFIRKMRMSGLISIRGAGRFIDINHNEDNKVSYILNNYCDYKHYEDEYEYFKYMSQIDTELISQKMEIVTQEETNDLLAGWLQTYNWETIKCEMKNLAIRKPSKDNVLKLLAAPARLEFLTALAIKSKMPQVIVKPNYRSDDTGLPTSTAGGNKGDIECFENGNGILIEVTMAGGRTQTMMEIWPIQRHLLDFIEQYKISSQCIFIAPSIFSDSKDQIRWVQDRKQLIIRDYPVEEFTEYLERAVTLYL